MLVASLVVDQGNQILVSLDLLKLLFASVDTSLSLGSETGKAVLMKISHDATLIPTSRTYACHDCSQR
jgi:hypothetical protein